jgi:hypothetical protein
MLLAEVGEAETVNTGLIAEVLGVAYQAIAPVCSLLDVVCC